MSKNLNILKTILFRSWQVWTRIQREKDTLKQLISVSHPHLHLGSASAHSHGHGHSHSHASHAHNTCQNSQKSIEHLKPFNDLIEAKAAYEENGNSFNCGLM